MTAWRVGFSCLSVCVLVGNAAAQNPTFWLEPTNAKYTQKCVGGPEYEQPCSNTADCGREREQSEASIFYVGNAR